MLARFTGKAGGVDDLHIAEYPGPVGLHEADEIEKNITDVLVERIVSGLTSSAGSATAPASRRSWSDADARGI